MTFRPETTGRSASVARDFDRLRSRLTATRPLYVSATLSGTTSGTATLTAGTLSVPAREVAGVVQLSVGVGVAQTVGTDTFGLDVFDGTAAVGRYVFSNASTAERGRIMSLAVALPANTARTFTVRMARIGGTGTATVVAAPASWFDAVWHPTG